MKKILLPLALSLALVACQTTTPPANNGSSSSSIVSATSSASMEAMKTYSDTTKGYSISYPESFIVQENDTTVTEDFELTGTSFVFPESTASGNTLNSAKVNVAVVPTCPARMLASSTMETINGASYQRYDWSGVGAGNLYQGTTYSTTHNNSCYVVTLYMHSCNLGPDCSEGHTQSFEKKPLEDIFSTMMQSFKTL